MEEKLSKNILEGILDIARVNLFLPRVGFEDGTYGGYYPKGIFQTIIADVSLGVYLGLQSPEPELGTGLGFVAGFTYPLISGFLGMYIVENINELKKTKKK